MNVVTIQDYIQAFGRIEVKEPNFKFWSNGTDKIGGKFKVNKKRNRIL